MGRLIILLLCLSVAVPSQLLRADDFKPDLTAADLYLQKFVASTPVPAPRNAPEISLGLAPEAPPVCQILLSKEHSQWVQNEIENAKQGTSRFRKTLLSLMGPSIRKKVEKGILTLPTPLREMEVRLLVRRSVREAEITLKRVQGFAEITGIMAGTVVAVATASATFPSPLLKPFFNAIQGMFLGMAGWRLWIVGEGYFKRLSASRTELPNEGEPRSQIFKSVNPMLESAAVTYQADKTILEQQGMDRIRSFMGFMADHLGQIVAAHQSANLTVRRKAAVDAYAYFLMQRRLFFDEHFASNVIQPVMAFKYFNQTGDKLTADMIPEILRRVKGEDESARQDKRVLEEDENVLRVWFLKDHPYAQLGPS